MSDIAQWRRVIQASRARTPALEPDDFDGAISPSTPKLGLRPKLSNYFLQTGHPQTTGTAFASSADEWTQSQFPSWPDDQPYPQPSATGLIDSITCRLMRSPYHSLDLQFNGPLLQIFEAYRNMLDAHEHLRRRIDEEVKDKTALVNQLQRAQQQWTEERQHYKAEIKRLELVLAKGEQGLTGVTTARQHSVLRQPDNMRRSQQVDASLQTIFDALERSSRHDEKAWNGQRGMSYRPLRLSCS
jgi:hypothetical protein